MQIDYCEEKIDDWVDRLNWQCKREINQFYKCVKIGNENCKNQELELHACANRLKRPHWFPKPPFDKIDFN